MYEIIGLYDWLLFIITMKCRIYNEMSDLLYINLSCSMQIHALGGRLVLEPHTL